MTNCIQGILEYSLSPRTPVLAFLMIKNVDFHSEQIKKMIENVKIF
jgi:hypothetical protein